MVGLGKVRLRRLHLPGRRYNLLGTRFGTSYGVVCLALRVDVHAQCSTLCTQHGLIGQLVVPVPVPIDLSGY